MALAVGLERGGILHLFFLFLPVYGFAMIAYWVLAKAMGAGDTSPAAEAPSEASVPAPGPASSPVAPSRTWSERVSGVVAALALASCLWLGYCVLDAPPGGYDSALDALHSQLTIPTLVYFVAGTVFFTLRDRARQDQGAG